MDNLSLTLYTIKTCKIIDFKSNYCETFNDSTKSEDKPLRLIKE